MNLKLKRFLTAISLGFLCVLPFAVMEIVNLGGIPDPFPYTIFLYLWLMFALFAFGYLFGFVGLLLAVPLAAAAGVLIRFAIGKYLESQLYLGAEGPDEHRAPAVKAHSGRRK